MPPPENIKLKIPQEKKKAPGKKKKKLAKNSFNKKAPQKKAPSYKINKLWFFYFKKKKPIASDAITEYPYHQLPNTQKNIYRGYQLYFYFNRS